MIYPPGGGRWTASTFYSRSLIARNASIACKPADLWDLEQSPLKRILVVFGTRPEAIKMAPVVNALRESERLSVQVCVTAQHREMLDQVLGLFEITPEFDLDVMAPNQGLDELTARIITGVGEVIDTCRPDMVLVHGDTTTTMATSLASFYRKTALGHVEAGLRSGSMLAPWPEEMNRRVTSLASTLHFAPTERARQNLLSEGHHPDTIHVTGNTVIDALLETSSRLQRSPQRRERFDKEFNYLDPDRRLVLVTGHRRENFGEAFENICSALLRIADLPGVQIVYPVHPNPNVREPVARRLTHHPQIRLIDPLEYEPFVYLMGRSHMIITDSGGIQEEAPSLGKPVLVMRETTERPEAVEAGTVVLVGTSMERITNEARRLLTDPTHYRRMSQTLNPYGDGQAARRIRSILES